MSHEEQNQPRCFLCLGRQEPGRSEHENDRSWEVLGTINSENVSIKEASSDLSPAKIGTFT